MVFFKNQVHDGPKEAENISFVLKKVSEHFDLHISNELVGKKCQEKQLNCSFHESLQL